MGGVILVSFHVVGALPCAKNLKGSVKGFNKGFGSCYRCLLLIPSGPAAFHTKS